MNIALGITVVLVCVFIQAATIMGLHRILHWLSQRKVSLPRFLFDMAILGFMASGLFFGLLAQAMVWAATFMLIGEIADLDSAFYFSLVNFTTLGYGDITLSREFAALGPMEAANGVLMLGLSTSFFYSVAVKLGMNR